jgi:hypothetical protein
MKIYININMSSSILKTEIEKITTNLYNNFIKDGLKKYINVSKNTNISPEIFTKQYLSEFNSELNSINYDQICIDKREYIYNSTKESKCKEMYEIFPLY